MNWDALGALGEIIGAAAVVASLIYLATQMRQTNTLARAATYEAIGSRCTAATDTGLERLAQPPVSASRT